MSSWSPVSLLGHSLCHLLNALKVYFEVPGRFPVQNSTTMFLCPFGFVPSWLHMCLSFSFVTIVLNILYVKFCAQSKCATTFCQNVVMSSPLTFQVVTLLCSGWLLKPLSFLPCGMCHQESVLGGRCLTLQCVAVWVSVMVMSVATVCSLSIKTLVVYYQHILL